jgi:hypothetical protein
MDTNAHGGKVTIGDMYQEVIVSGLILLWRRRMGIEPTHRGLNPEHWI